MRSALVCLGLLAVTAGTANAAEVLHGTYESPGKLQLTIEPLGVQVAFNNGNGTGFATYKLNVDLGIKIANVGKIGFWLGPQLQLGGVANLATIEFGAKLVLSFEKYLHIPLMPIASVGIGIPISVFYGFGGGVVGVNNGDFAAGGLVFKFGGGAYYYIFKNFAVGGEMDFAFGFQSFNAGGTTQTGFFGYWDFLAGVRVAF